MLNGQLGQQTQAKTSFSSESELGTGSNQQLQFQNLLMGGMNSGQQYQQMHSNPLMNGQTSFPPGSREHLGSMHEQEITR